MMPKLPNQLRKNQIFGLVFFGILALVLQVIFNSYNNSNNDKIDEILNNLTFHNIDNEIIKPEISAFNPNDLNAEQWQKLGFSEKQSLTILNYKKYLGGNFKTKEQIKKCYAISDEKFLEIEPYIILPKTENNNYLFNNYKKEHSAKKLNINQKFNPDLLSKLDWIKMGFSEKQAEAILNYKNYLGGSFQNQEKLKSCYIIDDEQFKQMLPYLILPKKSIETQNKNNEIADKIQYQPFNPNRLTTEEWQNLGFSKKQAESIINYKNNYLKGNFKSLEEIKNCFVISEKKFEEIKPFIIIEPIETISEKTTATTEKPKTNFNNINLNEITYNQLIEFGFNSKNAGGIIAFRNSLGGFVHKNQLFETYNIDRDLAEKLVTTSSLNLSNVKKYTLYDAPESWLKTHPYFKYSADKIIYFRLTNTNEKKLWKILNIKPEYKEKMKLYLK